jgi:hypothetical protein
MRRIAATFLTFMALGQARPCEAAQPIGISVGDGGVSSFYDPPASMPKRPGVMLREQKLPADHMIANAAAGVRILYSASSGLEPSRIIAVSGEVFLPAGKKPQGGWPIIAWAHGTTGIADVCAPSWHGRSKRDSDYLAAWLAHGFAIVATDYSGLGTPGVHPYLLYRPEGIAILDAVRAAVSEPSFGLANRIILDGQSQGAGAALGAAWLHTQYAPGLDVKAAVLTGLVATIAAGQTAMGPAKGKAYTDPSQMDPGFAMLRFAGTDRALHPDMDPQTYLTDTGKLLLHVAQTGCLHDLFKAAATAGISKGGALFSRSIAPVDSDMEANFDLPNGHIDIPVFVGTGLADAMAGTAGQYNAVAAMCAAGTQVTWHTYPGLTHNGTVNASLPDAMAFTGRAMSAAAPSGTCRAILPPGKIQAAAPGIPFND